MPNPTLVAIDPRWTVNDTLLRYPVTAAVFNAFGVDACCGGAAPLERAARDADVTLPELLHALVTAATRTGSEA